MTDVQKALSYAEGFLTAMAAVLQDREYTDGKITKLIIIDKDGNVAWQM